MLYRLKDYKKWYKHEFFSKKITIFPDNGRVLDCYEFIKRNRERFSYPILKDEGDYYEHG